MRDLWVICQELKAFLENGVLALRLLKVKTFNALHEYLDDVLFSHTAVGRKLKGTNPLRSA
jgi:hypothetical protein